MDDYIDAYTSCIPKWFVSPASRFVQEWRTAYTPQAYKKCANTQVFLVSATAFTAGAIKQQHEATVNESKVQSKSKVRVSCCNIAEVNGVEWPETKVCEPGKTTATVKFESDK
jgi:hypothetical protein